MNSYKIDYLSISSILYEILHRKRVRSFLLGGGDWTLHTIDFKKLQKSINCCPPCRAKNYLPEFLYFFQPQVGSKL